MATVVGKEERILWIDIIVDPKKKDYWVGGGGTGGGNKGGEGIGGGGISGGNK